VSTQGVRIGFIDQLPTSCFQKSAYYAGISIFNSLPSSLTSLITKKTQFKAALKLYLIAHSFCCAVEFMSTSNSYHNVVKVFLDLSLYMVLKMGTTIFPHCMWIYMQHFTTLCELFASLV
jgi:hypothetical protein